MPIVKFINENISIEVKKGTVLLDAIRKAGLSIEAPCNGMGICGKCKVVAKGKLSDPSEMEKKIIDENKSERLSCMALVFGDTEVGILKNEERLKTVNKGFSIDVPVDSPVKNIKLPGICKDNPLPYADYLGYHFNSPELYKKISLIEENNPEEIWGIVYDNKLLDITTYKKNILGVAIDVGTTGVSCYLIDLSNGEIIKKLSFLNPQIQYGGDVLTRITYCMENKSGTDKLHELIVNEINNSIKSLTGNIYNIDDIYYITVSANTTMNHLLLGINPESLAKFPYRAVFLRTDDIKAKDISIEANDEAVLTVIPSISSYVGGDIVSGIMASDFQNNKEAVFIDIGTNGEIAVLKNGDIISTSTAAGPALEGMNIECGCRAKEGAIETFDIDEEFNVNYTVIGNEKPIGICGSGLIDIVGALVKRNILQKSGRWSKNLDSKIAWRLADKKFYITDDVYISQKDIRQIQLAKGAIASGMILLLDEIGLDIQKIPNIYIAGAFGYHINPDNIKTIGLIPKGFRGEIRFLGNTSLEGARLVLINKQCLKKAYYISKNVKTLELSLKENFQDVFISQLNF